MNNKNENKKTFADNLRYYMQINNVDRKKLSADLDIKYSTLCEWLKATTSPRIDKIIAIADYFEVSASVFFKERDEESESKFIIYEFNNGKITKNNAIDSAQDLINSTFKNSFGVIISGIVNNNMSNYKDQDIVIFENADSLTTINSDYCIKKQDDSVEIVRLIGNEKNYLLIPIYNASGAYDPIVLVEKKIDFEVLGIAKKIITNL